MAIEVNLLGADGLAVKVSPNNELITAPLEYSTGTFQDMDTVDTAFNFIKPTAGKRFVITGILLATDRNIGVNGADIVIYEAGAADATTVDTILLQLDLTKNQVLPVPGLNSITKEGKFINGKTDDASVRVTLAGYEVDAF